MNQRRIILLSAAFCVAATVASAKNQQCTVKYKAPGSTTSWTITAQSSYDAVAKWEQKIKKGDSRYTIIDVQCK